MIDDRASASRLGVGFVAGFLTLAVLPALVWQALIAAGVEVASAGDLLRQELAMIGFVAACALIVGIARALGPDVQWRPAPLAPTLRVYGAFVLLWVPLLVGYLWAARAIGAPVEPQGTLTYLAQGELGRPGFWLVVLGVVVAAPLGEEVLFRGLLQGALQKALPGWAAIALAATGFGVVHTLPYALPVGLLGALFGWLYLRSGSLWPSVTAHALHNGLTVLVTVAWPGSLDLLY